jgi:pimeloyl-ACP methyl ester carboxylesterase
MSTFLLVHGAWQGASTWDLIVPKLQSAGHTVIAPVLTGLGEDSNRLSATVNLESHIEDVEGILKGENLHSVTLVGHSYAGMVITGTAEVESSRLKRLIYVDAFIPDDGESALDLLPEAIQNLFREQANAHGEGWRLPASEDLLDLWGLQPGDARDYVRRRLCDFSLSCFEQKARFQRMRLPRSRKRISRPSLRTIRLDSCLNDLVKGPVVSAGFIVSCLPGMIAMSKPRNDLLPSCWPAMRRKVNALTFPLLAVIFCVGCFCSCRQ